MWDLVTSLAIGVPVSGGLELTPLWSGILCGGIYLALSGLGHA